MSLVMVALTMSEIHPGEHGLLVVDTQPRYLRVHRPELEKWLLPLGWVEHRAEMRWVAPNGSSLTCIPYFRTSTRSSTTNPLEGFNGSYGLVDEAQALPLEVVHKLLGRLRAGKRAQVFLWGLPVWGAWWERYADENGGVVLLPVTRDNAANLSEDYMVNLATLPERERLAMVENKPQPPEGSVFDRFDPVPHPVGNLTPLGWKYNSEHITRLAADFGFRHPAATIIVYDPDLDADVIVESIFPEDSTVREFCAAILTVAWPRDLPGRPASAIYHLDSAVGDKAGRARSDQTGVSTIAMMQRPPSDGGVGLHFRTPTPGVRTDIANGVRLLQMRFERRRLLISADLWEREMGDGAVRMCRSIVGYRYRDGAKDGDLPWKDGTHDHGVDLLRYDQVVHRWLQFRNPDAPTVDKRIKRAATSTRRGAVPRKRRRSGGR